MGKTYLKNKKQLKNLNSAGFTIVELLVVIVVIGILAAITIVSYSGITQRAKSAALQSDLTNAKTTLQLYQTLYGSYPTALDGSNCPSAPTEDTKYCLKTSNGNSYNNSYSSNGNGTTFVLTETDSNGTKNIITNSSGVGISLGSGAFYSIWGDDGPYSLPPYTYMDFVDGNLDPGIVPSSSSLYKITFTSGALSGLSYNISDAGTSSWNGKQYFHLSQSMPNSPITGDTFSVLLINP